MRYSSSSSRIAAALGIVSLVTRPTNAFSPIRPYKTTTISKMTSKDDVIEAPYGSWKSPITPQAITAGSVGIGSLKLSGKNKNLLWLESRPQEGGRNVLCQYDPESNDNERHAVELTPKENNVRTRVHEYGGGAVTLGEDGTIFFSDFMSQRILKMEPGNEATFLTANDVPYRYADGVCMGDTLYCVREDHTNPAPKDVVNEIVAINTNTGEMNVIATGYDFYSNPRLHKNQLAYIAWNHPNMPWDASELRLLTLGDETSTSSHTLIAGENGDTSVLQPSFHEGNLYYVSDESGYYNIYRYKDGKSVNILPMEYDFGGSSPGWVFGQQGYTFTAEGKLAATYSKEGSTRLIIAHVSGDGPATDIQEYYGDKDGLPMQFGSVISTENKFYFLGGSPRTPNSVYEWSIGTSAKQLACSSSLKFDDGVISIPQSIEFPTTHDRTAYGYYYPPHNSQYTSAEEAPPLLVKAHGGPTSCTSTLLNAGIQFWTSRGFAVLDVDYGGSTGYGRDYRRRLRKSWGVTDVDDVCAGAEYLVQEGKADPKRLCIDGGSAGGYTTLSALAFRNTFQAGTSLYGIGDLTLLAGDTHKFESRYLDGLVGEYPQEEALYKQRSPIESVDTFDCPILLLQGDEDKVVPPNQAETMHEVLKKKGIPTCLKLYEREQHGFRQAKNIEDALESELAFYGTIFGFPYHPNTVQLNIDNLETK